jgi:hypothetical protein
LRDSNVSGVGVPAPFYGGYLYLMSASLTRLRLARNRFPSFGRNHGPAEGAGLDKAITEDRVLAARSERARLRRQVPAQRVGIGRRAPHHLQRRGAEREGCWEGGSGLISPRAIGARYPDTDSLCCEGDVVAAVGSGENGAIPIDGGDGDDLRQRSCIGGWGIGAGVPRRSHQDYAALARAVHGQRHQRVVVAREADVHHRHAILDHPIECRGNSKGAGLALSALTLEDGRRVEIGVGQEPARREMGRIGNPDQKAAMAVPWAGSATAWPGSTNMRWCSLRPAKVGKPAANAESIMPMRKPAPQPSPPDQRIMRRA